MGTVGAEAVATAVGGETEDGPGAAPATKGRKEVNTRAKHCPGDQRWPLGVHWPALSRRTGGTGARKVAGAPAGAALLSQHWRGSRFSR